MISSHPDARHDWESIAAYARLVHNGDRPWVLVGHSVQHRQHQHIKNGRIPAFVDDDGKVRFTTTQRGMGKHVSLWVRYMPRRVGRPRG